MIKLGEIIGATIVKIKFSGLPDVNADNPPLLHNVLVALGENPESPATNYSLGGGTIYVELSTGHILCFSNSEWGGMMIFPKTKKERENVVGWDELDYIDAVEL